MTDFSYIAVDKKKDIKRGLISSSSCDQLRKVLAQKGLDLISCQELPEQTSIFQLDVGEFLKAFINRSISDLDKITFSHHLSVMLKAGLPITEAVEALAIDVANFRLKKIISQLRSELETGKTLSSFLGKINFYSKAHLAILKAGETSGEIEVSLARISKDLKRDYKIKKKIKGAMAYPTVITVVLILISGFIITFVLPEVGDVFIKMNLPIPLATRILLYLGSFLSKNIYQVIGGLTLVLIFLLVIIKSTNIGAKTISLIIASIPFFSRIVFEINMARFIRSLSSLLASGVPISESLETAGQVFVNKRYKNIIKQVVLRVEKGESLSAAFRQHKREFQGIFLKMCAIGERSGKLADILEELALFYEEEVDQKLENFSTIIEPILMLIVGIGVGGMVLSIIGPIYQMVGRMTP